MIKTMNDNPPIYEMPNMGCLLGSAYQVLLGQLSATLEEAPLSVTTAE